MPRPPSDKITVNMRFPTELLADLNAYTTEENGYPDRSSAIKRAIEFLIHSKECIECGCLNPGDGKYCSRCGARLYSDEEIKNLMRCAYMYGIVVTSVGDYIKNLEPMPDNQKFKEMMDSIKEYTSPGLKESIKPVIDRNYPYNDINRYRFEVSFILKDSDKEVLPKQKIEFSIPYHALTLVMADQFRKTRSWRMGEKDVPSPGNLKIYTPFNSLPVKKSQDALTVFEDLVMKNYWKRVEEQYGTETLHVIQDLDTEMSKKIE